MDQSQLSFVSAVVSSVAAIASIFFSLLALRTQKRDARIQATSVRNQYFTEMRAWASEVCVQLSGAAALCDLDPKSCEPIPFSERRHVLMVQLSAAIDRGRWFFPNHPATEVGMEKPGAYRGYRQRVLTSLVAVFDVLSKISHEDFASNKSRKSLIIAHKRVFISEVQSILNPRERVSEFERLMGEKNENQPDESELIFGTRTWATDSRSDH